MRIKRGEPHPMRQSHYILQSLEHEIIGKKPDLEKLRNSRHHYLSEDELNDFQKDITQVCMGVNAN